MEFIKTKACYLNSSFKRFGLVGSLSGVIYDGFILASWLMFCVSLLVEDKDWRAGE